MNLQNINMLTSLSLSVCVIIVKELQALEIFTT